MRLGQIRQATLTCFSPCFTCGPRALIPCFGFILDWGLGLLQLDIYPFWIGPCQVNCSTRSRPPEGLEKRTLVKASPGILSGLLSQRVTFSNLHKIYSFDGREFPICPLPQQVWLKRGRKCAQDEDKSFHPQPMLPGLRDHPGPGDDQLLCSPGSSAAAAQWSFEQGSGKPEMPTAEGFCDFARWRTAWWELSSAKKSEHAL